MRAFVSAFFTAAVFAAAAFGQDPTPSRTRLSFDAGAGVRLWDLSDRSVEERRYLEQSRTGFLMGLDIAVFPVERVGLGIAHARFYAAASDDDIAYRDMIRGPARDEFLVHYVAPALFLRRSVYGGRAALVAQAGAGALIYRNESPRGPFPGVQEGLTPGVHAGLSADVRLSSWLGVGVGARFVHGSLDEVHYNAMETKVPEISLTRVDFLAGFRIYP